MNQFPKPTAIINYSSGFPALIFQKSGAIINYSSIFFDEFGFQRNLVILELAL